MKKHVIAAVLAMGIIFNMVAMNTSNEVGNYSFATVTDEFKKVTSNELTPAVVQELLKEYPTSKLGAVYKNTKGEFKLIMVLKSGSRRTVYIDSYGNWINKK